MYKFFIKWILILATALLVILPEIYLLKDAGFSARINLLGTDAESHYLSRINEVYDGHYFLGNTYFESKNIPYLHPAGGELIEGLIGKVLNTPIYWLNIWFKFISVIIIFWMIHQFVFYVSKSWAGALLAPALVILGKNFFSYPIDFFRTIFGLNTQYGSFNWFERPINPEISAIVIFGFLLCFYLFYLRKEKKYLTLSALLLGFSFYLTVFAWGFLSIFTGIFFLIDWWRNRKINWHMIGIGVAGALLSVPYWINFWQASQNTNYAEAARRLGAIASRAPVLSSVSIIFVALIIFFVWIYKNYELRKNEAVLGISVIVAIFLGENQQIITGQIIQPAHFHSYLAIPMLLIAGSILAVETLRCLVKEGKIKKIVLVGFISVSLIFLMFASFKSQVSAYENQKSIALNNQGYAPVIEWLNKNVPKGAVVEAVPQSLGEIIPVYTGLNVYYSYYAQFYLNSFDQLEKGLFLEYKLRDLVPEVARRDFFQILRPQISSLLYGIYYRDARGGYENIPDDIVQKITDDYSAYYNKDWSETLAQYPLDYIIVDTNQDVLGLLDPDLLKHLNERAVINDRFIIFSVRK